MSLIYIPATNVLRMVDMKAFLLKNAMGKIFLLSRKLCKSFKHSSTLTFSIDV